MKRPFAHALIFTIPLLVACVAPPGEDEATSTSEAALGTTTWKSVFRCGGAHLDSAVGDYAHQLVVDDPGAASYLKDKLRAAMENDPFAQQMWPSTAITPAQPNELVWKMSGFAGMVAEPKNDFIARFRLTNGDEIRADVKKTTWDQPMGNGLFRKVTDMSVRIVRNGYRRMIFQPGLSGDPDSWLDTGEGWNEWEVANWTFRGCRND
jgi:hypothetical protein